MRIAQINNQFKTQVGGWFVEKPWKIKKGQNLLFYVDEQDVACIDLAQVFKVKVADYIQFYEWLPAKGMPTKQKEIEAAVEAAESEDYEDEEKVRIHYLNKWEARGWMVVKA